jgi:hypothetical protein
MPNYRFDPELASEMSWSECVLAASQENSIIDNERETFWCCADCEVVLTVINHEQLDDTAQEFLDKGWRYRRVLDDMDAVCPKCRTSRT